MLRLMYSGISGMRVNQVKLDVTGNNIANVGTTAFKGQRARFQDMLSQNVSQALGPGTNQGGVNPRQIGLGVQVAGIDTIVTQGMMQPTSRNLDVAVDGEGYFIVGLGPAKFDDASGIPINANHTMNGGAISPFYTRDGSFTLDTQGNLLTSDGYRIMGYSISNGINGDFGAESIQSENANGKMEGQINFVNGNGVEISSGGQIIVDKHAATFAAGEITVPLTATGTPETVTMVIDGLKKSVTFDGTETSLDSIISKINEKFPGVATKKAGSTTGTEILVLNSPTKGYGSSIDILDKDGNQAAGFCGLAFNYPTAGSPVYGTLDVVNKTEPTDGTQPVTTIQTIDATGTSNKAKAPLVDKNVLKPLRIPDKIYETTYSKGDPIDPSDLSKGYSINKDVKEIRIRTFSIDKDGSIKAVLDDGRVSVLGQVAMASFKNPAGLEKLGKNLYQNSDNSGEATVRSGIGAAKSTDNSEGYGDCMQGMLEMSNVDLAEQFTDMIVASRAFQASGKTISTGDEILQDIINLKR